MQLLPTAKPAVRRAKAHPPSLRPPPARTRGPSVRARAATPNPDEPRQPAPSPPAGARLRHQRPRPAEARPGPPLARRLRGQGGGRPPQGHRRRALGPPLGLREAPPRARGGARRRPRDEAQGAPRGCARAASTPPKASPAAVSSERFRPDRRSHLAPSPPAARAARALAPPSLAGVFWAYARLGRPPTTPTLARPPPIFLPRAPPAAPSAAPPPPHALPAVSPSAGSDAHRVGAPLPLLRPPGPGARPPPTAAWPSPSPV